MAIAVGTVPPTEYCIDSRDGSGFVVTVDCNAGATTVTVGRENGWASQAYPGEVQPALQAATYAANWGFSHAAASGVPQFVEAYQTVYVR